MRKKWWYQTRIVSCIKILLSLICIIVCSKGSDMDYDSIVLTIFRSRAGESMNGLSSHGVPQSISINRSSSIYWCRCNVIIAPFGKLILTRTCIIYRSHINPTKILRYSCFQPVSSVFNFRYFSQLLKICIPARSALSSIRTTRGREQRIHREYSYLISTALVISGAA